MKTNQRIKLLSAFGCVLDDICQQLPFADSQKLASDLNYNRLMQATKSVKVHNGWFTEANVLQALGGIRSWLFEDKLNSWLANYKLNAETSKTVGLIMAGNIPLVGFHDFLAVFLSGNKAQIKLSSDDAILWPIIVDILTEIDPEFAENINIVDRLVNFDAVIATGSNNSATYFQAYFGKYPHIIRKNRTSVAVLTGNETTADLENLGKDIFNYFGLGCRNVTQILVPKGYNLTPFFESIYVFNDIINHHKYANNYDYNKAIYLLNSEDLLDNNFLLVRTAKDLNSPIGVLFKHEYENQAELEAYLNDKKEDIQAIVGHDFIPFGNSQAPGLMDYADGVDTLKFLTELA